MATPGRPIDAFIQGIGPAIGRPAGMLNLAHGGMYGALPDHSTWVNNAPYVQQHAVFRLLRAPSAFALMGNAGNIYREYLKTLLEIKAKRFEGLKLNVDVSYDERELDGSGNKMHTPSDAKREESELSITWDELDGMPISHFWKDVNSLLLVDPMTKKPRLSSMIDLPDMLPERRSWAGLAYETDTTNRFVTKAILIDNCMAKSNGGEMELKMDKNSEMEPKEVTIAFTGFTLDGPNITQAAQELHDEISRTLIDPHRSRSYIEGVEANIASIAKGYKETLETIAG